MIPKTNQLQLWKQLNYPKIVNHNSDNNLYIPFYVAVDVCFERTMGTYNANEITIITIVAFYFIAFPRTEFCLRFYWCFVISCHECEWRSQHKVRDGSWLGKMKKSGIWKWITYCFNVASRIWSRYHAEEKRYSSLWRTYKNVLIIIVDFLM